MLTSAATTELTLYGKQADFLIEWRSEFSTTGTYAEAPWISMDYSQEEDQPATLSLSLANDSLLFSNELSTNTKPSFLGAYVRATARVGNETQVVFFGQLDENTPSNENFSAKYSDPLKSLAEANCEQTLEPSSVEICDENHQVAITQIDSRLGEAYGIPYTSSSPNVNAFAQAAVAYALTLITTGTKTFRIAGNHAAEFPSGTRFQVIDNTPATVNGWYTSTGAVTGGGNTDITVSETIASSTISGGKILLNGQRRAWTRNIIQVWKASGSMTDPENELAPSHYQVDYVSGAVTILEEQPQATYYISGVSCYKESAATGATNVDFVRLYEQMLGGLLPGQNGPGYCHEILAVSTGLGGTFTIPGDYREWFASGTTFHIIGSTNNTGRWTVSGTPTYSSGKTVITVTGTVGATADGHALPLDAADVGIDIAKAWYFYGRCGDFLDQVKKEQQANLKFWFDASVMKFKLTLITQAAVGSQDWTLLHPIKIDQGRNSQELFTSIELVGQNSIPPNRFQEADKNSRVTDLTDAGSQWSIFDGANVSDDTFANAILKAYDGDANYAALNHNLPATYSGTDTNGLPGSTGTTKYDSWYPMIDIDMGEVLQIQRVRFVMPGSRNANASQRSRAPGVWFWPGVAIMVSADGSNYFPLAPQLYKHRDKPGTEIEASDGDILRPKARYVRVYGGAYKEGFDNQSDPAIGIGELDIYTDTSFRVKRRIAPLLWIRAVNAGAKKFTVDGNWADGLDIEFLPGDTITVTDSTGNDGTYTISTVTKVSATTEIVVVEAVPSGTADGYLYNNQYYMYSNGARQDRAYPSLWKRFGRRFKLMSDNIGTQYNKQLARDRALSLLAESIRLLQAVDYDCPLDPRVKLWQTVKVDDDYNGDVGTILVRRVSHHVDKDSATSQIGGVNYLAAVLS